VGAGKSRSQMTHGAWYSIFLPFRYNDGTPVEESKFAGVRRPLMERFGGMTEVGEPEGPVQGSWSGFGYTQTERMTIFAVFAEDINSARSFLEEQKLLWQSAEWFDQEVVFVTETPVEVL